MGATFGSLHVAGGELNQIKSLFPDAEVGTWAEGCVSVFDPAFVPGETEKAARKLSKKVVQPVLCAWIFDSDAVSFSIFQAGKCVVCHVLNPEGFGKMGNIPLFCKTWALPPEDAARLRVIWKKGDAEEQLSMTASLMGLPLFHDSSTLPENAYHRDTDAVDQWIRERPVPPKIKNEGKAELIQELTEFRISYKGHSRFYYVSEEPYDDPYSENYDDIWEVRPDGTLQKVLRLQIIGSARLRCITSEDRLIGIKNIPRDFGKRPVPETVVYDSASLLPVDFPLDSAFTRLLDNGCIITEKHHMGEDHIPVSYDLICLAADGTALWCRENIPFMTNVSAANENEVILCNSRINVSEITRVSLFTGEIIGKTEIPIGLDCYKIKWHDNAWWGMYDLWPESEGKNKIVHMLAKLDRDFRVVADTALPSFSQEFCFGDLFCYVYICEDQVMVFDKSDLSLQNVLKDKDILIPREILGEAAQQRLWMQRGSCTVEAWDSTLTKTISRFRLKGSVMGHFINVNGNFCVTTWDEKKNIFRVYRFC